MQRRTTSATSKYVVGSTALLTQRDWPPSDSRLRANSGPPPTYLGIVRGQRMPCQNALAKKKLWPEKSCAKWGAFEGSVGPAQARLSTRATPASLAC